MRVLTVLLICAMSAAATDLAGRYRLSGVPEVASELMLKPDGTFEYMLIYGAADYTATGAWTREGDAALLTTTPVTRKAFELVSGNKAAQPEIRIRVVGPQRRPVPNIDAVLGDQKARTDQDGYAKFPPGKAGGKLVFEVRVYSYRSDAIELNPAHNDFVVEIHGEAITTVPFKGERLALAGDDLEMRYWNKDKPMRYRRQ